MRYNNLKYIGDNSIDDISLKTNARYVFQGNISIYNKLENLETSINNNTTPTIGSSTIGSGTHPVYFDNGVIKPLSISVGDENEPVIWDVWDTVSEMNNNYIFYKTLGEYDSDNGTSVSNRGDNLSPCWYSGNGTFSTINTSRTSCYHKYKNFNILSNPSTLYETDQETGLTIKKYLKGGYVTNINNVTLSSSYTLADSTSTHYRVGYILFDTVCVKPVLSDDTPSEPSSDLYYVPKGLYLVEILVKYSRTTSYKGAVQIGVTHSSSTSSFASDNDHIASFHFAASAITNQSIRARFIIPNWDAMYVNLRCDTTDSTSVITISDTVYINFLCLSNGEQHSHFTTNGVLPYYNQ